MKPIRILIVDDHSLFRSGIKLALQRHAEIEIVGEASDGLEGIKRAKQLQPDLVLLDLHMPGTNGLEALRLMQEDQPNMQVVMLTVSEDADDLLACLQAGARGYLLKNIDTAFLLDSVQRAARGESVMSPQIAHQFANSLRSPRPTPTVDDAAINRLTPREREIIVMVAHGQSNKEIAATLTLAESTVKIHVQGILRKLNLSKRVQAAVYAVEHGLA